MALFTPEAAGYTPTPPEQKEKEPALPYDALVVLGKNIGIGSSREDIKRKNFYLSIDSKINVLAAGLKYKPGMKIIFSSGHTAGEDIPSEALAMKTYLLQRFDISDDDVIVEDNSLNTPENAEEVGKKLQDLQLQNAALMTVSYHLPNAMTLFENYGTPIKAGLSSDQILFQYARSPEGKTHHYQKFIADWEASSRVKWEKRKEFVRSLVLKLDKHGNLFRLLTRHRGR